MLIDFDKGKEDVVNRKLEQYCQELNDRYEYPLRGDYEEPESESYSDVYFDYQLYLIDIEGSTVVLYFDGVWYSMVAIQFAKGRWHKHDIVRWIDRMGVIETAISEMDHVIVVIYNCPETIRVPLSTRANWIWPYIQR